MWLTNMSFWKRRKNWIIQLHYNSGKHIFKIIDSSVESGSTARIVLTQQKIECVVFCAIHVKERRASNLT
jgi:hypothetical protein